jgi:hypothetical protein
MKRTLRQLFPLIAVAAGLTGAAVAQPAKSPGPVIDNSVTRVTLGQSAVPLYGPWKFTVGDSPIDSKTGKPLWAEPEFDDSKWETVDLTPKDRTIDPNTGQSGYVPGWTAKGHPGYSGYAWYRIQVRVQVRTQPGRGEELALAGPADVDDGYQFFDNGELRGHFGDFTGTSPVVYATRPMLFPLATANSREAIPAQDGTGPNGPNASGLAEQTHVQAHVLAFRLWMEPITPVLQSQAGGLHSAPVLGEAEAVAAGYQMRWLEQIRFNASYAAMALLFAILALVAFSLILFDRSDPVYLWMAALFLLVAFYYASAEVGNWTELLGGQTLVFLQDGILVPLTYAAWVMVWRVWFGQRRPNWLPQFTGALALLLMVSEVLGDEIFFGLVPHEFAVHFVTVALAFRVLIFALLVWVVVDGIRLQGVEGWLVLPVVLLRGIGAFAFELSAFHIRLYWFPFGVSVHLVQIANLLIAVVIALLLLRRLLRSVKRQREMALDVKQAQEVQQVILPEAHTTLPGFAIESVYRPAREVGGDFFQIIPHKTDGSLLIVAGDVTGKGLQAGMLVALLVGAIRTEEQRGTDPASMLSTLNQRLMGRGNAQATCLALRIDADGAATLANAGHLAPYLNGEELPMEGALPLGIVEGAESSVMHFELKPGDRLVLMSDGIAESTDANGNLFGFERVHGLLRTAGSAAEVANAAQAFGQEDDISVIAVTRMEAATAAMAS